jgi:hypothetical protein
MDRSYPALPADPAPVLTLHEPDARVQQVPEAVLQDLWARQDFARTDLRTTDGLPISVLDPGRPNADAGPDFSSARLRIGGVQWAGDVEIHRTSGEWRVHRHDSDPAYDRVVLHVVLVADRHTGTLRRTDGSVLPELILLPRLTDSLRHLLYRFFVQPAQPFPCAGQWSEVPDRIRRPWLRLLGQERLQAKVATLFDDLVATTDRDEVLYRAILRALGYAPNAAAMERVARLVPLCHLRTLHDPTDAEALLLGAAGFVPVAGPLTPGDELTATRVRDLTERFANLREMVLGMPAAHTAWKAARLRPANAPARRIVQAAALFGPGGPLHESPVATMCEVLYDHRPRAALRALLQVEPDAYWRTHIRPEVRCRDSAAGIGRERADRLVLDAILPVLLGTAGAHDPDLDERILEVATTFPAAEDRVTRVFTEHGYAPKGALEAQGLHQLYRTRCSRSRCLRCTVGRWLLER